MRKEAGFIITCLLTIGAAGCDVQPVSSAPAGAPPGIRIPVGPIPGPGSELSMLPVNPYQKDAVALQEGRRLFVWYNCSGCHGGHGGGGMGPSLRDPDWRFGGEPAHIFDSIAQGRGQGMPAWGSKLPEEEIWKLVAYIQSMRTATEPDPPIVPPVPRAK